MKKVFMAAVVVSAFIACNDSATNKQDSTTAAPATTEESKPAAAANPLEDQAIALISKSDCMTCHKVNEKLAGPAYIDVANKYENTEANVNMLVEKVQKGGKGNWGETMMLAHADLSKEDATVMVKYILSLKK
ncbi:MAG: Cytochrome c-552 precursor [Bacteroidota bacterium]|jgi:cytochrome c